ncbi:MAG: CcoQ/FixQ family Cbb3-type cytochrome c oxidase assembly chaperone [Betaproteobacteria bacterium]
MADTSLYSVLSSVLTVLSFAIFLGIVAWAWSKRRRAAFEEAANAPFALPDDVDDSGLKVNGKRAERRS